MVVEEKQMNDNSIILDKNLNHLKKNLKTLMDR